MLALDNVHAEKMNFHLKDFINQKEDQQITFNMFPKITNKNWKPSKVVPDTNIVNITNDSQNADFY